MQKLGLTPLNEPRVVLTNKFGIETARNEKHNDIFLKKQCNRITRKMFTLEEPFCRTERYFRSAIPYMTRTLNGVFLSKKERSSN